MISPTRIAEITALAEAATPGPWYTGRQDGAPCDHIVDFGPPPKAPYMMLYPATGVLYTDGSIDERNANAAFIAAARTAVPELLADREAMVARMASATEAFESIKEFADSGENFLCWKVADDALAALKEQS